MSDKKAPMNPEIDAIVRKIVKEKKEYKFDKKETDPSDGVYGIEVSGEDITFFVYLEVQGETGMVTFTTVVDNLTERADRLGILDDRDLYIKVADAVTGYSFRLAVDEDFNHVVEFRYTALDCTTEKDVVTGIDTCIDACCDYIQGLEEEVGIIY